jgi:hypothetical protein
MRMDEPRAPQYIRNQEEEQRYHKKQSLNKEYNRRKP